MIEAEDRELDAQIAELLGWEWWQAGVGGRSAPVVKAMFPPGQAQGMRDRGLYSQWKPAEPDTPRAGDWDRGVPRFSVDLNAARMVLDFIGNQANNRMRFYFMQALGHIAKAENPLFWLMFSCDNRARVICEAAIGAMESHA
jgi:hypothetical protein